MQEEKSKKLTGFSKAVICECIVLAVALFVFRGVIFPHLAQGGMKHVAVATHSLMIGITATLFSVFAIFVKRAWKSHKKYILLPFIFTIFGYLMLMLANEMNF